MTTSKTFVADPAVAECAWAALVLAALAAKGESTIKNIQYIDRGYESFEKTLSGLGANVRRVQIPDDAPLLVSEGAN